MRNVNYVKADGTMVKTLAEAGKGAKVKLTEETPKHNMSPGRKAILTACGHITPNNPDVNMANVK